MNEENNKLPSALNSSQFIPYISRDEINGMVTSLANTISQKYAGEDLILIGLLKGSMFFVSDLIRQIKGVNVFIDFIMVDSIGRNKEEVGTIRVKHDIKSNVRGKNVLLVQEITQSGRAIDFVQKRLNISNPRNIEIITLFDKPYKRVTPINANYIGKKIEDHFVVGYGLDLDQYGRNLNDLYYLKYPN